METEVETLPVDTTPNGETLIADRRPSLADIGGPLAQPLPVSTPTVTPPADAPAPAETPAPAAAPAATPAPADAPAGTPAGEDDPYADLTFGEEGSAAPAGALTDDEAFLSRISEQVGLEQVPASLDELSGAIEARIAAEVAYRSSDPIRQLSSQLTLDDRALVKAEMMATKTKFMTEAVIDKNLNDLDEEGGLAPAAEQIREEIQAEIDQRNLDHKQAVKDQQKLLQESQKECREALASLKDPYGQPYPDKVRGPILDYMFRKDFIKGILSMPTDQLVALAIDTHPVIGPFMQKKREALLGMKGASAVYKEIEVQAPGVGTGAAGQADRKPTSKDIPK